MTARTAAYALLVGVVVFLGAPIIGALVGGLPYPDATVEEARWTIQVATVATCFMAFGGVVSILGLFRLLYLWSRTRRRRT
jgi:hypothetical protein